MHFPIIVICEGRSEANMVQRLNALLQPLDGQMLFSIREANGGSPKQLIAAIKKAKQDQRKPRQIWIFADKDLYVRNKKLSDEANKFNLPIDDFSVMNFEDVLMLFQPTDKLKYWISVCQRRKHFEHPLAASEYQDIYKNYMPDYEKGILLLEISKELLDLAFHNMAQQISIRSGFLLHVKELLDSGEIKYISTY